MGPSEHWLFKPCIENTWKHFGGVVRLILQCSEKFGEEQKDSSVKTDNTMTDNSTQTVKKTVDASIQTGVAFLETKQSVVQCGPSSKEVRGVGIQASSAERATAVNANEVGLVDHGCSQSNMMKEWIPRNVSGNQRGYQLLEDGVEASKEKSAVQMKIGRSKVSVYEKRLVAVQEDVVVKCGEVGHPKIDKCVEELNKT